MKAGENLRMRGLNKLYYLKIDIKNMKKEIKEIEEEIASLPIISSPQITGMPHGADISNPTVNYVLKKEELTEKLKQRKETLTAKLLKREEEEARLEDIIERINDPEVKAIARMRFIDNMKWGEIGAKLYLERTTCSKKLKRYIDKMDL